MKPSDKLTEKGAALLAGTDTLDLYLKEMARNQRTMMGQADLLERAILEMEKQVHEHIATESEAAVPQNRFWSCNLDIEPRCGYFLRLNYHYFSFRT